MIEVVQTILSQQRVEYSQPYLISKSSSRESNTTLTPIVSFLDTDLTNQIHILQRVSQHKFCATKNRSLKYGFHLSTLWYLIYFLRSNVNSYLGNF